MEIENLEKERTRRELAHFEDLVISTLVNAGMGIVEGTVMSLGPAPYRRVDYRGRALAFIKLRPTKRALRIDVTGWWPRPWPSRLQMRAASGATTLMVKCRDDVEEAVQYLLALVGTLRAA